MHLLSLLMSIPCWARTWMKIVRNFRASSDISLTSMKLEFKVAFEGLQSMISLASIGNIFCIFWPSPEQPSSYRTKASWRAIPKSHKKRLSLVRTCSSNVRITSQCTQDLWNKYHHGDTTYDLNILCAWRKVATCCKANWFLGHISLLCIKGCIFVRLAPIEVQGKKKELVKFKSALLKWKYLTVFHPSLYRQYPYITWKSWSIKSTYPISPVSGRM